MLLRANGAIAAVWMGGLAAAFAAQRLAARARGDAAAADESLHAEMPAGRCRMPGPLPVQWLKGERGVGAPRCLALNGGGLALQEAVLVAELLKVHACWCFDDCAHVALLTLTHFRLPSIYRSPTSC